MAQKSKITLRRFKAVRCSTNFSTGRSFDFVSSSKDASTRDGLFAKAMLSHTKQDRIPLQLQLGMTRLLEFGDVRF
jgi:hypothetical protein